MIFEKFNPEIHDYHKLANLTYDVDFRTYEKVFPNKESAIFAIEEELLAEYNFGNDEDYHFLVILNNHRNIVGMIKINIGKTHNFLSELLFLFRYLKIRDAFRLARVGFLDYLVLADVNNDDLYIAEIAIDPETRGQGLGRLVINKVLNHAKHKGFKRVVLDADFRNNGALKLYESIGFRIFDKKSSKIFDSNRGMYNLEYILK
jgi:ribosomal protein S18 acetylase RimI-like enzyme